MSHYDRLARLTRHARRMNCQIATADCIEAIANVKVDCNGLNHSAEAGYNGPNHCGVVANTGRCACPACVTAAVCNPDRSAYQDASPVAA